MTEGIRKTIDEAIRWMVLEQAIARKSDEYDRLAQECAARLIATRVDKTQVRGLETLARTTDRVSDITDWLKLRVGRDSRREGWAKEGIGRDLVTELEGLRSDARKIVNELRSKGNAFASDPDLERQVHLRLCREFIKHLAAHFEYLKAERER
jgi:hypothetical protein